MIGSEMAIHHPWKTEIFKANDLLPQMDLSVRLANLDFVLNNLHTREDWLHFGSAIFSHQFIDDATTIVNNIHDSRGIPHISEDGVRSFLDNSGFAVFAEINKFTELGIDASVKSLDTLGPYDPKEARRSYSMQRVVNFIFDPQFAEEVSAYKHLVRRTKQRLLQDDTRQLALQYKDIFDRKHPEKVTNAITRLQEIAAEQNHAVHLRNLFSSSHTLTNEDVQYAALLDIQQLLINEANAVVEEELTKDISERPALKENAGSLFIRSIFMQGQFIKGYKKLHA